MRRGTDDAVIKEETEAINFFYLFIFRMSFNRNQMILVGMYRSSDFEHPWNSNSLFKGDDSCEHIAKTLRPWRFMLSGGKYNGVQSNSWSHLAYTLLQCDSTQSPHL
jgi:hypothetical protein